MNHHIIGLCSLEKSGKDYFYTTIYPYAKLKGYDEVNRFSFADKVREELKNHFYNEHFPISSNDFDLNKQSTIKSQLRPLMKAWSESKKLIYGDDYWAKTFIEYSNNLRSSNVLTVVTDLSFPLEFETLKEYSDLFISLRLYNESLYENNNCDLSDPINASTKNRISLPVDFEFINTFNSESMVRITKHILDIIQDRTTFSPKESPFFVVNT